MVHLLTVAVLALVAAALVLLNVRIVMWLWCSWVDHRAEQRAADLVPHLIAAHKELRRFRPQIERLKRVADQIQRKLWGRETN